MKDRRLLSELARVKGIVFDFDGVFTDNIVTVDGNGLESVSCWRSDGLGLERIKTIGKKVLILSTETNPVVSIRAGKLKVHCIQGVRDKARALEEWIVAEGLAFDEVAYVGNDINDLSALKSVGFPIAVADCYEEIVSVVKYRTLRRGGRGAVREVCDLLYSACVSREDGVAK